MWKFDSVKLPHCCASSLNIQISPGKASANSLFERNKLQCGCFSQKSTHIAACSSQIYEMTHSLLYALR